MEKKSGIIIEVFLQPDVVVLDIINAEDRRLFSDGAIQSAMKI